MDTNSEDFDPLESTGQRLKGDFSGNIELKQRVEVLHAKEEAFRSIADRFYMLWWNLPNTPSRQVDQELRDLFRMFMDLAPAMGVSRNGIPELKECCGRKRDPFHGEDQVDLSKSISGADEVKAVVENLGWCPGDIIRRITRVLGFEFCQVCDQRRRKINAFFRCGDKR